MTVYDAISGLVGIIGGCYAFLLGTGRIDINPQNPDKSKIWREKNGRFMKWAGPVIVMTGVLNFFGVL